MPEGVAKEAKAAKEDSKPKSKESPKRRPAGNGARVKVELLDGSVMDLEADVSSIIGVIFISPKRTTKQPPGDNLPALSIAPPAGL